MAKTYVNSVVDLFEEVKRILQSIGFLIAMNQEVALRRPVRIESRRENIGYGNI